MAQIASVAAITGTGKAFAVNEQGVSRELKAGDVLQKGETIRTVGDVRVELLMEDGRLMAVAPNQVLRLDENVSESDQRPTAQDSAVGAPAETADTILQALERGTDLSTELEATAAGLGGGGGADGGSSFVQLLRVTEGVDPLSYQYDYTAQDPLPDLEGNPEILTNTPPTILVGNGGLVADNAEGDVFEAALGAGGSNADGLGETLQGRFLVSDPQGVASLVSVTINGQVIPMGSLVGTEVPGESGVLTITSFDPATGIATFEYKLSGPTVDVPDQLETETFTFTTTDGEFTSNTATITLNIVDDVPEARADAASPLEDTPVIIDVFANDVAGADGVNLATGVALASAPTKGTVVYNGDGTFTYTPTPGQEGTDSFTYTITDGDGDQSTATATVTLAPDSAPTAGNDTNSTPENGGVLTGSVAGNDSVGKDAVGATYTAGTFTGSLGGTLVLAADGSYTYTPPASVDNSNGDPTETFTYTLTDGDGTPTTANLVITITDTGPTAGDDTNTVAEGRNTLEGTVVGGDSAGNDATGAVYTAGTFTGSLGGTLVLAANGSYTYTSPASVTNPQTGTQPTETFTYTLTDGDGTATTANLVITITDTGPTAGDDTNTVAENGKILNGTVAGGDSAGNDSAGATYTAGTFTGSLGGTLVLAADGSYTYTAPASVDNSQGDPTETFSYTLTDGDGTETTADLVITITDTGPVAVVDTGSSVEGSTTSGNVLTNDTASADGTKVVTTTS
ncbi:MULTISPECIES: retention module-containing protein, partial [Comamonadaceae]